MQSKSTQTTLKHKQCQLIVFTRGSNCPLTFWKIISLKNDHQEPPLFEKTKAARLEYALFIISMMACRRIANRKHVMNTHKEIISITQWKRQRGNKVITPSR